jgi:hypothetical protein
VAVVVVNTAVAVAVAVATNPLWIFRAGFGANRASPFFFIAFCLYLSIGRRVSVETGCGYLSAHEGRTY